MTTPGPTSDNLVVEGGESRGWTCQGHGGKTTVVPVSVDTRAGAVAAQDPAINAARMVGAESA